MKFRTVALMMTLCIISVCGAQGQTFVTSRVFPSGITQTEPVVAIHPTDPLMIFASAVTINLATGFRSEGVYVTTNGGLNWFGSDTCKGALITNHGGDPGIAVDQGGRLILTHIGSVFAGVYSHYSTNLGSTWTNAYTITSDQPEDKGTTTIDDSPSSPFYGRVYATWVNLVLPYPVLVSYSTNSGQSWTAQSAINNPPPARCSGGSVTTDLAGRVYVCWAGVSNTSPFTENFVGFAASTNGGVNWSQVSQNIFAMNGINGTLPSKGNIRVNGLPGVEVDKSSGPRNGWLYIVTTEKNLAPAGTDPDVILHRSSDMGATWSSAKRVNQDPINNGKIQYFPAMHVDAQGGINIIYYDDRNTSADSTEVVLARSLDGGDSWREYVISDHRFRPKPIAGGSSNYQGDHIALTSAGNTLHAFWMSDFSGLYQVWTARIDLQTVGVGPKREMPNAIELSQNFPNPFNPTTTIEYQLSREEYVNLRVMDILGREVAVLVDARQQAGKHQAVFDDKSSLSSGTYLYQLKAGGIVSTKAMILLK